VTLENTLDKKMQKRKESIHKSTEVLKGAFQLESEDEEKH